MSFKRPKPRNEESPFEIHELFFSRTDLRGVIETGNAVFTRVSGYSYEQLVGKPHSIIRHPDMPRAVFKLAWDTIQAGQPIVAYVKNLAADGRYYWVLASIFPVENGYISIRLKPSSHLLEVVNQVYQRVLAVEEAKGMEAGLQALVGEVQKLGFPDYRPLARLLLVTELESREAKIKDRLTHVSLRNFVASSSQRGNGVNRLLCSQLDQLTQAGTAAQRRYHDIYAKLKNLSDATVALDQASRKILDSYRTVTFLPLNMAVESERVGAAGRTLAVVSDTFRKWSGEVNAALKGFFESVGAISERAESASFNAAASRLQVEMINFLISEICERMTKSDQEHPYDQSQDTADLASFLEMTKKALLSAHEFLAPLAEHSHKLKEDIRRLQEAISALYIIRQSGRMEVERLKGSNPGFHAHLASMGEFLNLIRGELKAVEGGANTLNQTLTSLIETLTQMESDFKHVTITVGKAA